MKVINLITSSQVHNIINKENKSRSMSMPPPPTPLPSTTTIIPAQKLTSQRPQQTLPSITTLSNLVPMLIKTFRHLNRAIRVVAVFIRNTRRWPLILIVHQIATSVLTIALLTSAMSTLSRFAVAIPTPLILSVAASPRRFGRMRLVRVEIESYSTSRSRPRGARRVIVVVHCYTYVSKN